MNIFSSLLDNSKQFNEIITHIEKKSMPIMVSGTADAQKAHLINSICEKMGKRAFVITHNDIQARRLCDDLGFFFENEWYISQNHSIY